MLSEYDAKYLVLRERDARDEAAGAIEQRLFDHCRWIVLGVVSDEANGYRHCPRAACRRARRCSGTPLVCRAVYSRARLPAAIERAMVEELYWKTQEERQHLCDTEGDQWWRALG